MLNAGLSGTAHGSRIVVALPASIGSEPDRNIGDLVVAAWAPGVTVVIADMAGVVTWDLAGLLSLMTVHRSLVAADAELRLVVWSADLYAALQAADAGFDVLIYANLDAALRAARWLPAEGQLPSERQ